MVSYKVRILDDAINDFKRLDTLVIRRISHRIQWLADNIELIKPFPLKGELSDLYKAREGSYRIIYQLIKKERTIIIHNIGHRSEIYKRR